jgi:hypothetical protein
LTSGSVDAGGALVFTVDLSGLEPGTVATMTFDLAGFGPRGSQVKLDDVVLTTKPDPTVPVAGNDTYTTSKNHALDVSNVRGVLANDNDPLGRSLTAYPVQLPRNGTLSFNSDGSFRYEPDADFVGQDQFVYQAITGSAASTPATVTIIVTPNEQRPPQFTKGADQSVAALGGAQRITGWATNILAGLPDPGPNTILNFSVSVDHPELFAVLPSISADGALTFTPNAQTAGVAMLTVP